MNRSILAALLTVTMVILTGSWSYAVDAPHNFACDQCHEPQGTNASMEQRSHACVGCHSTGSTASRMAFDPSDMSNRFGSTLTAANDGSQSTHNYKAAAPYADRAKVNEPTDPALNTTNANRLNLVGYVGCIRCHDVKLAASLNVTLNANKPLLRVKNTNDYLCVNCHTPRQKSTDAISFGTHPVYRSYSAAYKSNTTAFRRVPKNANVANPNSDLGRYLNNNQVICTTCHASHYADSSSATYDNRSTAGGFYNYTGTRAAMNKFAKSTGNLLRTDYKTAGADDINTCSACHKETAQRSHNNPKTKMQNMQCNDCHSAHVDYDTADGGVNNELLRRFYNFSTQYGKVAPAQTNGVWIGKAVFNGATSRWYKTPAGTGICQSCHVVPVGAGQQAAHDVAYAKAINCDGCHNHKNGFTGDVVCTSCHGQPPVVNTEGGPFGKAVGYTLDESMTPHATHASGGSNYGYKCYECHYPDISGAHNTATRTFQTMFADMSKSVGLKAGYQNTPADYNTTARTCSNVYCHSNGAPRGGAIAYKNPAWNGTKGSIVGKATECVSCHESGSTLITNAHPRHVVDAGKSCATCHLSTVDASGKIIDRAKHANAVKDIAIPIQAIPGISVVATYNTSAATCTNSCHRNVVRNASGFKVYTTPLVTASWTDSRKGAAYCGSCHAAVPATSAHPVHLTTTSGPALGSACNQCHNYTATGSGTSHVNGTVSILAQTTACASCHPNTASTVWTSTASVTCQSCHVDGKSVVTKAGFGTYTAPMKTAFAVSGHGQAGSNYDLSRQCTSCHSRNATDLHIGSAEPTKRLTLANDNGLCNSCHSAAAGNGIPEEKVDLLSHVGFKKYTTAASNILLAEKCTACHDVHGTTSQYMIKTVINGLAVKPLTNISSGFIDTVPGPDGKFHGLCQVCHTRTKVYSNSSMGDGHDGKWCLKCHAHKDPKATFAFQAVGGCNVCHGYPPAASTAGLMVQGNYSTAKIEDYAGGGGAHTVQGHLPKTITVDNGSGYASCVSCHSNVGSSHNTGGTPVKAQFVDVTVDVKYKFNKNLPINYNSLNGTCSNVSCHYQATPKWSPVKQ